MQFLKKNYEKIVLGLVLIGLVVAVGFLPFRIQNEKQAQEERRNQRFAYPVKPLSPMDTNRYETTLKRAETPLEMDLASTNKLFNPVRWLKGPTGAPIRMPLGSELEKLDITKQTPLYLIISLETVNVSDSGVRYVIDVEQQAAPKANQRGKRPFYVSVGDRKEMFALREVKGPQDNPTDVIVELSDTGERISINKDKPFSRVDGYTVDLRYPPENKSFISRRIGDKILISAEEYNIVAITENEVVLSARSSKKYTIRSNAAP